MPNRIIKESICYSEDINSLTSEEEVFFYRLMVNCDDYGRCDARLPILKSKLYPLKENMKSDDINGYLLKLEQNKMIIMYENKGVRYLQLVNWTNHQQIRAKRSKHPAPNDVNSIMISSDIICNHMQAYVTENPNPNPNPNPNKDIVVGTTDESEISISDDGHEEPVTNNDATPYEAIKNMFEETCTTLPRIKEINDTRKKTIRTIWRQNRSLESFKELFERTARSDFLSGRDGKWTGCSFDWIIKQANRIKILEGNYDNNRGSPGKQSNVTQIQNFKAREYVDEDFNKYYTNLQTANN